MGVRDLGDCGDPERALAVPPPPPVPDDRIWESTSRKSSLKERALRASLLPRCFPLDAVPFPVLPESDSPPH